MSSIFKGTVSGHNYSYLLSAVVSCGTSQLILSCYDSMFLTYESPIYKVYTGPAVDGREILSRISKLLWSSLGSNHIYLLSALVSYGMSNVELGCYDSIFLTDESLTYKVNTASL